MLPCLSRLFLFLAEACDPSLQRDWRAYQQQRAADLAEISFQQAQVDALTAMLDELMLERDEALRKADKP